MIRSSCHRALFLAALATLALRALTPAGYMPGSEGSGLLFELCPDGLPAAVTAMLNGGGGHAHHHGDADDSASVGAAEQCPIGHMLASAVAVDVDAQADVEPDVAVGTTTHAFATRSRPAFAYRSRAPPA